MQHFKTHQNNQGSPGCNKGANETINLQSNYIYTFFKDDLSSMVSDCKKKGTLKAVMTTTTTTNAILCLHTAY